ncbi:MAG: hypothetical protein ACTSWN_15010 [Promethearchaeota archaeon]
MTISKNDNTPVAERSGNKTSPMDVIKKYSFFIALAISYSAILLTFTGLWQLIIIPPIIGGMFIKKKTRLAWWSGFTGTCLAWLTILFSFMATQPILDVADLLMGVIIGSSGYAAIAIALTLSIGGVIGGIGGIMGFSIKSLIQNKKSQKEN